ncbi:MAG: hypothetical protein IIB83_06870 [Bacteroidetes bacterium]|nr:hypothetical protein [Bacteroidota bacterium]
METKKKIRRKQNFSKSFDAVRMMRNIRNKISIETQDMSFEQFKSYMKKHSKDRNNDLEVNR